MAVLIKLARLGNLSLDRLLTTPLKLADLKTPDAEELPQNPQKMEVIGGGIIEGRIMFKGMANDQLITTDKLEKSLLTEYRKLNRLNRERCVVDTEWILNNPKTCGLKKSSLAFRKKQKLKNTQKLTKMANSIIKVTRR